jgi:diguanylate cyclase (GGDEF)-like protein
MEKMRMHPQLGAEIISNIKFPYPVADSVLAHHERFDGTGYPNQLKGSEIPLGARVLAVVDVFDAYNAQHPTQSQKTVEEAMKVVQSGAGTAFDPDVVAVWGTIYKDIVTGTPAASAAAYSDIQRAASEDRIALENARRDATSDKLTGLANRRAFEGLTASLAGGFSVVLIDVNSFKAINDNFGHNTGDAVLVRIAAHLRQTFVNAELICRLGGDEFVVVSSADERLLRLQVRDFKRAVVRDPQHLAYGAMRFGISCGVGRIPADAATVSEALRKADERMYAVKVRTREWGRNLMIKAL